MYPNKEIITEQLLVMANAYIVTPLLGGLLKGTTPHRTATSLAFLSEPDPEDEDDDGDALLVLAVREQLGVLSIRITVVPGAQGRLPGHAEFCILYHDYEAAARDFKVIAEAIKRETLMPKG